MTTAENNFGSAFDREIHRLKNSHAAVKITCNEGGFMCVMKGKIVGFTGEELEVDVVDVVDVRSHKYRVSKRRVVKLEELSQEEQNKLADPAENDGRG